MFKLRREKQPLYHQKLPNILYKISGTVKNAYLEKRKLSRIWMHSGAAQDKASYNKATGSKYN